MSKTLIGSILGILVIASIFIFLTNKQRVASMANQDETPTPSTSTEGAVPSSGIDELRMGGSSYADTNGVYTFLYPNDYVLDAQDEKHVRIYKRAETARPQGEITDGALVVFESIDLAGQTLEEVVDTRVAQSTEIAQPKKAITLNGLRGFTYELGGFGSGTHLYLQRNAESNFAVGVTFAVMDPNNLGYKTEVENTLSTLELLK